MVEIHTLGRVELHGADGRELRDVLAQPKRFALLVYLALASPNGYQRRDTLLGMFWPESDQTRARGALRQSIRFLRQGLGEELLINRGDDELGIAAGAVRCDVTSFRSAIDRGDAAGALQWYRGNFLGGFFVSGAPEFERWVEDERERLRRAAVGAARTLADAAQSNGEIDAAAHWARHALELSPADEDALRRVIVLLDRGGNRAAAVDAYEGFVERLRQDYELAPAPETTALIDRIRSRQAAPPVASAAATGALLNRHRVLIAPFDNRTSDPSFDALGHMAADWIAQGLGAIAGVEVVPPMAALRSTRYLVSLLDDGQPVDTVRALAEDTGAGTIVYGSYYAQADSLVCSATVADAASGAIVRGAGPVVGPRGSPVAAIERIAERIVAEVAVLLDTRVSHTRAVRPPSYAAYQEYAQALDRFIAGAWREALVHLRLSVQVDSGFTLPWIVSAIVHWNLGQLDAAETVARRASRSRHLLGPFEEAVLDMVLAWLRGDWSAAHEAVSRQARLAPDSIPHFQVAEEARRLNRPHEAFAVLSKLNPRRGELRGFFFYWLELTQVLHLLGRHRDELEAASEARALYPDHPGAPLLELRAYAALGRLDEIDRRLRALAAVPSARDPRPGTVMREVALELRAHGFVEPAQTLMDASVTWYRTRASRERQTTAARRELARSLYHAGRLAEAEWLFRQLAHAKRRPPAAWHHAHLRADLDVGYLGAIATRRRNRRRAKQIAARLQAKAGHHLFGRHTYWRAAIAALEGDADVSAQLLRQALSEGLPFDLFIHADPHFEGVRTTRAFQDVIAPKG